MKNLLLVSLFFVLSLSGCKEPSIEVPIPEKSANARVGAEKYSKKEIDAFMEQTAAKNKGEFSWEFASDEMIASAIKHSQEFLSVGYKIDGYSDKELTKINLKEKAWGEARQKIIEIVFEEEKKFDKNLKKPEDVIIFPGAYLPNFDLEVSQLSTIQKLRETGLIRYMEPSAYTPKAVITEENNPQQLKRANQRFTFGCGENDDPQPNLRRGADYTSLGGTPVSWNLVVPGLIQAWSRNHAGQGIKIAYFDTGCSVYQPRMEGGFVDGLSTGRTLQKISTLPRYDYRGMTNVHDDCGHGTASTSIGTAPRSGATSVGIAYKSSLVSVKTAYDPILNTIQEYRGVADGFTQVANMLDVKIISMSLGTTVVPGFGGANYVILSGTIRDGVRLAHQRGKLIFCAAGTDPILPSWLHNATVFPASMPEVVAITGVKEEVLPDGSSASTSFYRGSTPCDECFYSSKVDFVVINQKNYGNAKRVLCLTRSQYDANTFGGSSSATASFAAMAAVVWSKYPTYSATQLIAHLRNFASTGNSRASHTGWGVVNIDLATR